jgi:hypothetical protein
MQAADHRFLKIRKFDHVDPDAQAIRQVSSRTQLRGLTRDCGGLIAA